MPVSRLEKIKRFLHFYKKTKILNCLKVTTVLTKHNKTYNKNHFFGIRTSNTDRSLLFFIFFVLLLFHMDLICFAD